MIITINNTNTFAIKQVDIGFYQFCREATLFLVCQAMEPNHLLYPTITAPEQEQSRRLKSRLPFVPAAKSLLTDFAHLKIKTADLAEYSWNLKWSNNTRLHNFIPNVDNLSLRIYPPKHALVRPNRLGTGVGCFRSTTYK